MTKQDGTIRTVGCIGMGIMGEPMAANLVKAGYEVTVTNRTQSKTATLKSMGADVAATPAELAESGPDVILINVTDTPDVEDVIFGRTGLAQTAKAQLTVVDNSTINPIATQKIAGRLTEIDVEFLDAPVSGGDVGAKNGTLSIMVGGSEAAFERCSPLFNVLGKSVIHLGPAGAGQACKACNQIAVAGNLLAACEAIALAKKCGLDLDQMVEVVSGGAGGSWQLSNLGPKVANADYAPGFMIDLILKDLAIVGGTAAEHRLPLPLTRLAESFFHAAAARGHGREGTQAIAAAVEALGGFKYAE